jgi:hypothetical protein
MYNPLKMTLIWLFIVVGFAGGRLFLGQGMKVAFWIPGNRHPLDRKAWLVRCIGVALGVFLVWEGWQLSFSAVWDILIVIFGSVILILFLFIPDFAHYSSHGFAQRRDQSTDSSRL